MLGLVTRVQPHFTLYYMPGCHVNKIYMENQCIKNMKYAGAFFTYCFQGTLPIYVYFSIKPEVSKETKNYPVSPTTWSSITTSSILINTFTIRRPNRM